MLSPGLAYGKDSMNIIIHPQRAPHISSEMTSQYITNTPAMARQRQIYSKAQGGALFFLQRTPPKYIQQTPQNLAPFLIIGGKI